MNTIREFRQNKFKIKVTHFRRISGETDLVSLFNIREKKLQNRILPRGGATVLDVTTPEKKDLRIEAKCSSKDSFNKKIAISVLIGRLNKQIEANN